MQQLDYAYARRFWRNTKWLPSGCRMWLGPYTQFAYGTGTGVGRPAHRVAVQLSGRSLPRGAVVTHSCDTPFCVNPKHLWVSTASQNARERGWRGRAYPIAPKRGVKFTPHLVASIRRRRLRGASAYKLGVEFGLSPAGIDNIAVGSPIRWVLNKFSRENSREMTRGTRELMRSLYGF